MQKTKVAAVTGALAIALAVPASAGSSDPLKYREVGGDGPRIVVRGGGCLQAEDSLELEVVEYTGEKVVYRCVQP